MTTIATINGNDNVGESRADINQNFANLNTDKVEGGVNLGTGEEVFASKSGLNLQFKSLVAGSNISISSNGTSITISSSGGGGGIPEAPNDGGVYARQSENWTALGTAALAATGDFATAAQGSLANTALQPSYISAGANVSFSGAGTSGDPIVISASGGGDISDGSITLPKLAPIPANTMLGNPTGGSASPQAMDAAAARANMGLGTAATAEVTLAAITTFLEAATLADARTALGLGDLATLDDIPLYSGTNAINTDFPVGSYVLAVDGAATNKNSTPSVLRNGADNQSYSTAGSGRELSGTWRARGRPGSQGCLFQRVS